MTQKSGFKDRTFVLFNAYDIGNNLTPIIPESRPKVTVAGWVKRESNDRLEVHALVEMVDWKINLRLITIKSIQSKDDVIWDTSSW